MIEEMEDICAGPIPIDAIALNAGSNYAGKAKARACHSHHHGPNIVEHDDGAAVEIVHRIEDSLASRLAVVVGPFPYRERVVFPEQLIFPQIAFILCHVYYHIKDSQCIQENGAMKLAFDIIEIEADRAAIVVAIEDRALRDDILHVFPASMDTSAQPQLTISGASSYSIAGTDIFDAKGISRNEAVFRLTLALGVEIRSHVTEDRCTLHASTAVISGRAICFLGASGSGKSTLSLLTGIQSMYLGDECAFLNLHTGIVEHAEYPAQIKQGSKFLFPDEAFERALAVEGDGHPRSALVPLRDLRPFVRVDQEKLPLGALVFPHYSPSAPRTSISELPASSLPKLFLESATAACSRRALLAKAIRLMQREDIRIYQVHYSDGKSAARELVGLLENGKSKHGRP